MRDLLLREVLRNEDDDDESIEIFKTSDLGGRKTGGRFTRPDLTAIVTSTYPALGQWRDVHAFEVKGYWNIRRDALYEAVAQAAMQRCSHSWLLAYIPDETVFLGDKDMELVRRVRQMLPPLREEADRVGVGLAVATSTAPTAQLRVARDEERQRAGVWPRRQVIDPHQLDVLLDGLEVPMEHSSTPETVTTTGNDEESARP